MDALAPELVRPSGSPTAGAELLNKAAEAASVHGDIATAWAGLPEDGRPACPYFGRGHSTLSRAVVRGGRLQVAKVDPEWRGNIGWRGDGRRRRCRRFLVSCPARSGRPSGAGSAARVDRLPG